MDEINIITRGPSSEVGTFGIWTMAGIPICVTCERPWDNNRSASSCIPPGAYRCVRFQSPRNGDCWLLKNVPGREMIEIHAFNVYNESRGCIGPGRGFGILHGLPCVTNSVATMQMLREKLPDEFDLTIV